MILKHSLPLQFSFVPPTLSYSENVLFHPQAHKHFHGSNHFDVILSLQPNRFYLLYRVVYVLSLPAETVQLLKHWQIFSRYLEMPVWQSDYNTQVPLDY